MEIDERLIDEIKKYPYLYDQKRGEYRDAIKRDHAWRALAFALNLTVDDLQRRWKNLRDRFSRERRIMKRSAEDSNYPTYTKWHFYEPMSYFAPYVRPRRSAMRRALDDLTLEYSFQPKVEVTEEDLSFYGSEADGGTVLPDIVDDDRPTSGDEERSSISDANNTKQQLQSGSSAVITIRKRAASEDVESAEKEAMSLFHQQPLHQQVNMGRFFTNEDDLFGLSVAATLKRLPPRSKAFAKLKIQEIMCEIEFGQTPGDCD